MTQQITVNQLKHWQANPPERQLYVSDDISRLMVRRNTDGSIAFCARRRHRGRREWKTFGRFPELGLAEARQMCRQWLAGVEVTTQAEERDARVTLGEVLDAYFAEIRHSARTWKGMRRMAEVDIPRDWLLRPAESISRAEVRSLLLSIGQRSGSVANAVQRIFSAAFNRAVDSELVERNPIAGMRRLFKEQARKNILDFTQLRQLWETLEEWPNPRTAAIQLLLLTGARRGEILTARWEHLGEDRWLKIPVNKSDRDHKIFLCDLAWELVSQLPSRGVSPYLFPSRRLDRPVPGLQDLKDQIAEEAAIGTWCIHDLRATFLSHSVEHCGTLPVVAKVCANHSLPGVTDANYLERAVYYPSCKEAWIAYGELIEGVVEGRVGKVLPMRSAS